MKLNRIKQEFIDTLSSIYPKEEIQSFFNILAEEYLGLSRIKIALEPEKEISEEEKFLIFNALLRLKKNEPIQYIIGKTEFYGFPFIVNKNVLIPRPETEELVDWIINDFKEKGTGRVPIKILDIGTGSGCIAIILGLKLKNVQITAIDISEGALAVANQNAILNKVNITFKEADALNNDEKYWTKILNDSKFDIIVSNPPYVRKIEKALMQSNVVDYEPDTALFVEDNDPLLFYKRIVKLSHNYIKENGALFFEINEYLSRDLDALLKQEGFKSIDIRKDVFGKDRMVKCNKHEKT